MRFFIFPIGIAVFLLSCDNTTQLKKGALQAAIIPTPREISTSDELLQLGARSRLYSSAKDLQPLLKVFQQDVQQLTGQLLAIAEVESEEADVVFELDTTLEEEEYELTVTQTVRARGGSYRALAMAKASLLQLLHVEEGKLSFPVVNIIDRPDASYRGLMIDLARQWHDISTIEQLIDLAAFYKLNYVQLHFTDYQSYTLPSEEFPNLSTAGKSYSFDDLRHLERYSQERGITIIPEIDVPGHSSPLIKAYPEIFAIADVKSNPYIINMGKEEVYKALDELIGEVADIFQASPYFHIGGDEAYFLKVMDDPHVKTYLQTHQLGNDVHELYRHFLLRLHSIVKKHRKQMCVWEGFQRTGEIDLPRDILVFEFETNRYLPNHLIEDGYQVVNASWKPLYVVNEKKWAPETIYGWNMWRWENWFDQSPSFVPIQTERSPAVVGAQMCTWEQAQEAEIPSVRRRLPVLQERIWNTGEKLPYEQFMKRLEETDRRLSALLQDERQDSLLLDYNFIATPAKE